MTYGGFFFLLDHFETFPVFGNRLRQPVKRKTLHLICEFVAP